MLGSGGRNPVIYISECGSRNGMCGGVGVWLWLAVQSARQGTPGLHGTAVFSVQARYDTGDPQFQGAHQLCIYDFPDLTSTGSGVKDMQPAGGAGWKGGGFRKGGTGGGTGASEIGMDMHPRQTRPDGTASLRANNWLSGQEWGAPRKGDGKAADGTQREIEVPLWYGRGGSPAASAAPGTIGGGPQGRQLRHTHAAAPLLAHPLSPTSGHTIPQAFPPGCPPDHP